MDLFDNLINYPIDVLGFDGVADYYGLLLSKQEADEYLENLLYKIDWQNDEAMIFGKKIVTKRKIAWYGENPYKYTYSKTTKIALPWIDELLTLKEIIENKTQEKFNSCLLNLYHNGSEGMAWHCDSEKDLKKNGAISSLSLGAERKFSFKHKKSKKTISLILQHGSLLVMKGDTQNHWLHRLPPTKMVVTPRVNLTFRMIVNQ